MSQDLTGGMGNGVSADDEAAREAERRRQEQIAELNREIEELSRVKTELIETNNQLKESGNFLEQASELLSSGGFVMGGKSAAETLERSANILNSSSENICNQVISIDNKISALQAQVNSLSRPTDNFDSVYVNTESISPVNISLNLHPSTSVTSFDYDKFSRALNCIYDSKSIYSAALETVGGSLSGLNNSNSKYFGDMFDEISSELNSSLRNGVIESYDDFSSEVGKSYNHLIELYQGISVIEAGASIERENIELTLTDRYLISKLSGNSKGEFYFDAFGMPYAVYYDDENSHIYIDYSSGNAKYFRKDPDTGDLSPISIFDDENIESRQYGASQEDFLVNFDELINDSLIWNEVQSIFNLDNFDSIDDAMNFYQDYFSCVEGTGCGFVVGTNIIFDAYKGKEDEFEKTFKFPMYNVDIDGNLDFNYELMTLKYFNYEHFGDNLDEDGNYNIDPEGVNFDDFNGSVFTNLCSFMRKEKSSATVVSDFDEDGGPLFLYDDYKQLADSGVVNNTYNDFTINLKDTFDNYDYTVYKGSGWNLYEKNGELAYDNGGGHYMIVTGYTKNNEPIVSSWGVPFILKSEIETIVNSGEVPINSETNSEFGFDSIYPVNVGETLGHPSFWVRNKRLPLAKEVVESNNLL